MNGARIGRNFASSWPLLLLFGRLSGQWVLALHSAFARHSSFGGSLFSILLRMNAQVVPRRFREVDVVVLCSFLDVCERQRTVGIGDVDDLIEPCDRITHMFGVGQWFFALLGKRVDTVG